MKLREFFPELEEDEPKDPSIAAAHLGLKPVGWGKYVDPRKPTKVIARVVDGKLEAMPAAGGGSKTWNFGALKDILRKQVAQGMDGKVADTIQARAEYSTEEGEQSERNAILNALRSAKAEMDVNNPGGHG